MLNEFEREEIDELKKKIQDLSLQVSIQQTLITALMSEMSETGFANFTPFDTTVRDALSRLRPGSDTLYEYQSTIHSCTEKATKMHKSSKVI